MAICVRCTKCGNDYRLDTPACHKCWNNLRKYRKFKVAVRFPNGTWRTKVLKSLLKARELERAWRQEVQLQRSAHGQTSRTTAAVWAEYITWAQHAKKTWKDDLCRWQKHIAPVIGHLAMDQVTQAHIEGVIQRMQKSGYANGRAYRPATIHQVVGLVKRLFNWAAQTALITAGNQFTYPLSVPARDKPRMTILTRDEIAHLLNAIAGWRHERAGLLVKFLLFSGRRKGEALALKWQAVDRSYRRIRFQRRLRAKTFTQTIPINIHCHAVLQRCWQVRMGDLVFPSRTGNYFHSFDRAWRNLRRKEGFRFLLRDLRHSFAFYILNAGTVDLFALGALMGHTSAATTQRYAHLAQPQAMHGVNTADTVFAHLQP